MDADNKGKTFGAGGHRGRIIFLGDGTEVLTGSDDTEMFDNADEDQDLESQVSKTSASTEKDDSTSATESSSTDEAKTEETKAEPKSKSADAAKTEEGTEKKDSTAEEVKKD